MSALEELEIPVSFQTNNINVYPHITFFVYNQLGTAWGDNEEVQTTFYIQLDIWSKTNYESIVKLVMKQMKEAGFIRTYAIDLWEEETKTYHKSIRFSYSN